MVFFLPSGVSPHRLLCPNLTNVLRFCFIAIAAAPLKGCFYGFPRSNDNRVYHDVRRRTDRVCGGKRRYTSTRKRSVCNGPGATLSGIPNRTGFTIMLKMKRKRVSARRITWFFIFFIQKVELIKVNSIPPISYFLSTRHFHCPRQQLDERKRYKIYI